MMNTIADNQAWLDGYMAHNHGTSCDWSNLHTRLGWLAADHDAAMDLLDHEN